MLSASLIPAREEKHVVSDEAGKRDGLHEIGTRGPIAWVQAAPFVQLTIPIFLLFFESQEITKKSRNSNKSIVQVQGELTMRSQC